MILFSFSASLGYLRSFLEIVSKLLEAAALIVYNLHTDALACGIARFRVVSFLACLEMHFPCGLELSDWRSQIHRTRKACLPWPQSAHRRLVVYSLFHDLQQAEGAWPA